MLTVKLFKIMKKHTPLMTFIQIPYTLTLKKILTRKVRSGEVQIPGEKKQSHVLRVCTGYQLFCNTLEVEN